MTMRRWRLAKPCANCPFSESAAGLALRHSLKPGRLAGIKAELLRGGHFLCHKTPDAICAGAIEWQASQDIVADAVQVLQRLEMMRTARKALHPRRGCASL